MISRGYAYTFLALALTVYGQLVIKWRVDAAGELPEGENKLRFLINVMLDPWVISSLVFAAVAAVAYLAALTSLEVSRAYPVMALSFAVVVISSAPLFGEALSIPKVAGVALITLGVFVATR